MSRKKHKAFWERGYNGHVLWLGKAKLGKVTVHAGKDVKDKSTDKSAHKSVHKYTWEAAGKAGASDDLDGARKAVEFAVQVADKQLDIFG
ncbi:MAG: hypothetical protein H7Y16_02240 [Candidatus Parcubacteria bacterium]|nr:hypothetical protein [Burkholderiales bacterium]